jgi:hypothetical protein
LLPPVNRVDGIPDAEFQVGEGRPHEACLPHGTPSASMMKALLFGLPLGLSDMGEPVV